MSEAVMQRLKISREGVILIKSFEGFRPRAIRRDDGQWVIGYGHTASAREGASVSEADAELLLQYDLIPIARALNEGVSAPLNQHQFDALASFAFSVGLDRFQGSNVLSRLNAGFAGEAADALVSWPEPVLPETSLRRRAAERALFVADPAWPIALSDLLVAPLPPPAVKTPEDAGPSHAEPATDAPAPVTPAFTVPSQEQVTLEDMPSTIAAFPEPASTAGDLTPAPEMAEGAFGSARSTAVAPLLSENAPVLRQPEWPETPLSSDAGVPDEDAVVELTVEGEPQITEASDRAPEAVDAIDTAQADDVVTAADGISEDAMAAPAAVAPFAPLATPFIAKGLSAMHRYSAYPGAIVGPLPPLTAVQPAGLLAADPALPAEPEHAVSIPEQVVLEAPEVDTVGAQTDTSPVPEAAPASAPWLVPAAADTPTTDLSAAWGSANAFDPFTPASTPASGPDVAVHAAGPDLLLPRFEAAAPTALAQPWPAISADSEPRTDGELLILTSPAETDVFTAPRLVWPHDDPASSDAPPLFEDDGSLRLAPGNIIRHEPFDDAAPARIPWGELGAYGLMGAFGLVSFGMSMAAFRRASQATSDADGTTLIAIVLAVIGAACVGVSAYNLYRRWGRADEE